MLLGQKVYSSLSPSPFGEGWDGALTGGRTGGVKGGMTGGYQLVKSLIHNKLIARWEVLG